MTEMGRMTPTTIADWITDCFSIQSQCMAKRHDCQFPGETSSLEGSLRQYEDVWHDSQPRRCGSFEESKKINCMLNWTIGTDEQDPPSFIIKSLKIVDIILAIIVPKPNLKFCDAGD